MAKTHLLPGFVACWEYISPLTTHAYINDRDAVADADAGTVLLRLVSGFRGPRGPDAELRSDRVRLIWIKIKIMYDQKSV